MKCLVTGGCGFIGSHIAEELLQGGHAVRIYDNLSSGFLKNIAGFRAGVEFIEGDIRNATGLEAAMKGVECVFHEAALVSVFDSIERPLENNDINIAGALNTLNSARRTGVRRIVMAASAAAYGNNPDLPKRESMRPEPESPYSVTKVAGEAYMRVFARLYGIETVSLRYFNVYGPRQNPGSMYSGVISKFVDTIMRGEDPTVFGDGRQTRDFVFVKDVVQANLLAMSSARADRGEVFNVGTSREISLLDLLEALRELTGRAFTIRFAPARPGDIRRSVADVSLAGSALGYSPRWNVRQGLRELLAADARGEENK
ncbi:MAG: SDR family oxidoreductase [Verrucomicrobiota bacterium]|nr:SDR family oxidoreductase [Verrucomicrobiota bacterium]